MTEALHLTAEAFDGFPLQRYCKEWSDSPFSCKKILIAFGTNLPGSTWISWAWSLQALKPPLSSRKSPPCWAAHCILPVNHRRAPTHSWNVLNATVSTICQYCMWHYLLIGLFHGLQCWDIWFEICKGAIMGVNNCKIITRFTCFVQKAQVAK